MATFLICLLVSIAEWAIYYRFHRWRRERYIEAEPQQGKPVDRVLYHELTDLELPWQAGESWSTCGRGYVVALERQGLGNILDERAVDDLRAVYCLGYTVREQADQRELAALEKRLERSAGQIERLHEQIADLKDKLTEGNQTDTKPSADRQPAQQSNPLEEAMTQWGSSEQTLDELMRAKGWVRISPTSAPVPVAPVPVIVSEPDPQTEPTEPEAEAEADQQPDYSTLRGDERKAAMTQLKDNGQSYTDIAKLFGVSVGCAKATISQYRKHQQAQAEPETNIIPVDFTDGLPSVSTG